MDEIEFSYQLLRVWDVVEDISVVLRDVRWKPVRMRSLVEIVVEAVELGGWELMRDVD